MHTFSIFQHKHPPQPPPQPSPPTYTRTEPIRTAPLTRQVLIRPDLTLTPASLNSPYAESGPFEALEHPHLEQYEANFDNNMSDNGIHTDTNDLTLLHSRSFQSQHHLSTQKLVGDTVADSFRRK